MRDSQIILEGIVGSHAYGLAREGSDIDKLGVFVAPTLEIAGLRWHAKKDTKHRTDPDVTYHEIGKFLRLALKGNPTILELFWLTNYEIQTGEGYLLLNLRIAVLCRRHIKNAYLGYATQQAKKLANRGDSFSSDTRNRTVKHGRHMLRLLRQARELARYGFLTVKVSDPEIYFQFDHMTPQQMLDLYAKEAAATELAFESTVLPEEPDIDTVEQTLQYIRRDHLPVGM